MSEAVAASGTVHWIGTGLSTGSGLRILCDDAARVVLWGRTAVRAEECLARLGLRGRAEPRAFALPSLAAALAVGDVVVSMLPTSEHAGLLAACVERQAHFACSSYAADALVAGAATASAVGIMVLTEAGLDPGIDHLLAHRLVAEARAVIGEQPATASLGSYCGGVPAVANAFRYRFSWSPRGVLAALRSPARYIEGGAEQIAHRPWEATRPYVVAGESFEAYPNRDSIPFIAQYGLPDGWRLERFIRGTLRLDGWREAWSPVFAVLRSDDQERIDALADDLAVRYATTDADRDRVILAVGLTVRGRDGTTWTGEYCLDVVGDEAQSAMARCVSVPLACGICEILTGRMPTGLRRAAESAEESRRWMTVLERHGIMCTFDPDGGAAEPG